MLRRLIFYLDYWSIERTHFYSLEKVTLLSPLLSILMERDGSLIDEFKRQCSVQDHEKYTPYQIVVKLIRLHEFSITREAIGKLHEFFPKLPLSTLELAKSVVKLLTESNSELQKATSCHPLPWTLLEPLFASIQKVNNANESLLEAIRKEKKSKTEIPCEDRQKMERAFASLRESCSKVKETTRQLTDFVLIKEYLTTDEQQPECDIEHQHLKSLITVDDMAGSLSIDIISSRKEGKPYKRNMTEVKNTLCSGPEKPSENIVKILENVDYANMRQIYGIDALSIPQYISRWSNFLWFQCPWVGENSKYSLADLIHGFLENASEDCAPGTYVCVGITTYCTSMNFLVLMTC